MRWIVLLYLVSWGVQGWIWHAGGIESQAFRTLAPIVMFFPGIAALIWLRLSGEGWRAVRWGIGRPAYLLYGALVPAVTALASLALIVGLGLGESPHLRFPGGRVLVERGPFLLGHGSQSWPVFLLSFLLTAIALGVVNGLVTVGEEVGWRGVLQRKLTSRLGLPVGIVVLGLVWAHWHTPIILMGYNFPENPVLGALVLWPATCILLSFVFAWLTIEGRSVWPAVVAHGSYNAFHGGLVDGMRFTAPRWMSDLVVLGIWLVTALGAWTLLNTRSARSSRSAYRSATSRTSPDRSDRPDRSSASGRPASSGRPSPSAGP